MTKEHYELIKLQIDLIELYPYDKASTIDILNVKDFELDYLVDCWTSYISIVSINDLPDDEKNIIRKVNQIFNEMQDDYINVSFVDEFGQQFRELDDFNELAQYNLRKFNNGLYDIYDMQLYISKALDYDSKPFWTKEELLKHWCGRVDDYYMNEFEGDEEIKLNKEIIKYANK